VLFNRDIHAGRQPRFDWGQEPLALPEGLPGDSVADMIVSNIQRLKSRERLYSEQKTET